MADHDSMLAKVRALLTKAEADGVTPPEAEALTAKAAELMAKYGIDRARLAAEQPCTDKPASRVITVGNPWAKVRAHLLATLADAMRCQAVLLPGTGADARIHIFGYASDLERADILYTSLLLQMASALRAAGAPGRSRPPLSGSKLRAWNRSFLLGYSSAVTGRVRDAEKRAAATADTGAGAFGGMSTALVLADRSAAVRRLLEGEYPKTRTARTTYTGRGYQAGYEKGQRADIGGTRFGSGRKAAVTR